ncbi:type II toxin-antitoxin system RelE/ParE family toxin [Niabella ginsengisoli]|uniref:Type II toxin-antitoxin system RelE/ParE family toxin n=1 Tax=Niabella ginsengisoli TaxID=522298 RepID=A0ABS9SR79_9BACT|nr:type II toxin-antitoxin system RelE/ParE family toxin [Niabella ginsengisoli]MCH5600897.1 type II toxin-antitoxin system RelE/ParE family toxin [Niabella ginsengisoli]
MIKSIQHKGLKLYWVKGDSSKLPADQIRRIGLILDILDASVLINDINFPGANLHALKGDLRGKWAVAVKANWRIVFEFLDGDVYLVDYMDYH